MPVERMSGFPFAATVKHSWAPAPRTAVGHRAGLLVVAAPAIPIVVSVLFV